MKVFADTPVVLWKATNRSIVGTFEALAASGA